MPGSSLQKWGPDLFTLNSSNYLLVADHFSRYLEIAELTLARSVEVVIQLKFIFPRHGIPKAFQTDSTGGPSVFRG